MFFYKQKLLELERKVKQVEALHEAEEVAARLRQFSTGDVKVTVTNYDPPIIGVSIKGRTMVFSASEVENICRYICLITDQGECNGK